MGTPLEEQSKLAVQPIFSKSRLKKIIKEKKELAEKTFLFF
jgi:hypothetical protein